MPADGWEEHRPHATAGFVRLGGPPDLADEIAARLGVGVDRSRQLGREALHRLRDLATDARFAA